MNITDDVIRDLLPLVQAGEASAETRALVEAYLASHPALAEEAKRAEAWVLPKTAALHDGERAALRRTKRLLSRRTWSMAMGFLLTGLPLSFKASSDSFEFLLLPGHPWMAGISLAAGLVAWIVYLRTTRALRPAGF